MSTNSMTNTSGNSQKHTSSDHQQTAWSEDRTIMANERTYASWLRTSLTCIGVALGFQALFRSFEPAYIPKLIATGFLVLATVVLVFANQAAADLRHRLDAHAAEPASRKRLLMITIAMIAATIALGFVLWML
jgi:putative membrane protein